MRRRPSVRREIELLWKAAEAFKRFVWRSREVDWERHMALELRVSKLEDSLK